MEDVHYDIAVVGAGVSSAYTVIHLAEGLVREPGTRPHRLAVVERDEEFWTGVPYGGRAGVNALIITDLREFLPEPERTRFAEWLDAHAAELLADYRRRGGALARDWLAENRRLLDGRRWEDLFLPRYFFGRYLRERVEGALAAARGAGVLRADLIRAEVVSVRRAGTGYTIRMRGAAPGETAIGSGKVVLAVGSPPRRGFPDPATGRPISAPGFVPDSHDPSLGATLAAVAEALERRPGTPAAPATDGARDVLIVGSNASAIEVVYALGGLAPDAAPRRIHVLSPGGEPAHWSTEPSGLGTYPLRHLPGLAALPRLTASRILEAVREECATALSEGFTIPDTIEPVSRGVVGLLDALDPAEQGEFVRTYGVRIGALQRRAGGHYQKIVRDLLAADRLRFVAGSFVAAGPGDGGLRAEYLDPAGVARRLPRAVAAIVNCAGFGSLDPAPGGLLADLQASGVCTANPSGRGFEVTGGFECAPGLHLLGPLLAGSRNESFRIWHAESCWRLVGYAQQLAARLAPGAVSLAS